MTTDSEWRLVRSRAEKAGMSSSEFLLSRGGVGRDRGSDGTAGDAASKSPATRRAYRAAWAAWTA